ncbi:hypothetical protein AB6878_12690 [Carnobacterium maltaromaticum]|uniref:hypothetical protein n=1 Tax=Carnobacterium maltaromaticum TaxID=2751 RepID=UPI0039BE5437
MANEVQIPLDPNPLGPMEPIFFTGTITPLSQVYANFIRSKLFGKHVREALARGILIASIDANEAKEIARIANAKSDETAVRQDDLEERWETVLAETTDGDEVIDARTDFEGIVHKTLKIRLDTMETAHFTIESGKEDVLVTLQDDKFSQNHVVAKVNEAEDPFGQSGLIIAEVGDPIQDTFYFEKVGEIE